MSETDAIAQHRGFGAKYNNEAWDLLEVGARSKSDDLRLLQLAHASYVHWSETGQPLNLQRAEHLVASVHSALGSGSAALHHARRCHELSQANGDTQTPFDRATALEALARAYASSGERDEARKFKDLAREAGASIVNPQGQTTFAQIMQREPWYGVD